MSLFTKQLTDQHDNINNETDTINPNSSLSPLDTSSKVQYQELYLKTTNKLRIVNNCLLAVLIVINTYIILVPLMPQLIYSNNINSGTQKQLEETIKQRVDNNKPTNNVSNVATSIANKSTPNALTVPSMLLDEPIIEGQNSIKALRQGVWRWPGGSTPDKGGNTVLAGHRFTYNKPKGTLYFLNKITIGDTIGVTWSGHTYVYKVIETKTVKTSQTDVLHPTEQPRLTLYTCTPLWNPKDRLVVIAELQKKDTK